MNHLDLIADNSRTVPDPGYHWSLAHDKCQRCHRTGLGVRTVGMKRPEAMSFTWLALCEPCVELGYACGWPMVAAVQLDPLAELRAALAEEVPEEMLRDEMPWRELGEGLPPSSPRHPVAVARFPSRCPSCTEAIGEGDPIALVSGKWLHCRCAS